MPVGRRYQLVCAECLGRHDDDGLRLCCPAEHGPALLRTEYESPRFEAPGGDFDLFRFGGWLPVVRRVPDSPSSIAYRAVELAREIGLTDLWVVFSGYWPERHAAMPSCTFKDLEAGTVLGRLPERPPVLVVASAGNTAAAFAAACARHDIRCLIVLPATALSRMAPCGSLPAGVRLVAVDGGGTYDDAIALAQAAADRADFRFEGGIRNVGRRDGLATCLLTAFEAGGRLPEVYVQAVGSGAGAVAVHEAAHRLRAGGYTEDPLPRHLLCQNAALAPLHDQWHRDLGAGKESGASDPDGVLAPELTNGKPPYTVRGAVRDMLTESGGGLAVAASGAARAAMRLFERTEGIDIEPPAGVALAGLADAVRAGTIRRDERVLLNVTGGGRLRRAGRSDLPVATPHLLIDACDVRDPQALAVAAKRVVDLME
jgi:cysteate synthase